MLRLPRSSPGQPGSARSGLPPGRSIRMTSAPASARNWVAWAPGSVVDRSMTRSPASGPASSLVAVTCQLLSQAGRVAATIPPSTSRSVPVM